MTDKWQPIETAPKDGTRILVWRQDEPGFSHIRFGIDRFENGMWWRSRQNMQPTHWMPFPDPPEDD